MTNQRPFLITHWCGIPAAFMRHADGTLATERIDELRDSGITLLAIDDCGVPTNREILHYCHTVGLPAMIIDHRVTAAVFDPLHREELLRAVVNDYTDCPALHSYYVVDEPHSRDFASLGEVLAILRRLDPAREGYINLFPNYASDAQLGNTDYREHLEQYLQIVRPDFLSYDHYHLMQEKVSTDLELEDARQNAILHDSYRQIDRPGFFDNLELVRTAANAADIPFMLIVLLTEHGPYRNLHEGEIRYEVYQALAYGSARISYFTYWTPPHDDIWHWKNGMITADGEKTQHYYDVQKINRELQTLGRALGGARSRAVWHIGSEPDTLITPWQDGHAGIAALQADRLTISAFDNGMLLLANKDFSAPQTITLTPTDGKTFYRCDPFGGVWEPLPLTDGVLTLTLSPGDAALLR